ncbi:MAG: hypothetical protein GY906_14565 [bacterium]|nr:hypothetical protein [bacterium]
MGHLREVFAAIVILVFGALSVHGQTISDGDDWSMPSWVQASPGTGFYSEEIAPAFEVHVRSVDVSWRQLNPAQGVYSTSTTGAAQGMNFPSLADQLADQSPFWMRIWASGVDWAPEWVVAECGITQSWPDYDDQEHLPIWDSCVWGHLMNLYRHFFIDQNLRADPRFRFIYVPGAFTWCEFDFEIIDAAAGDGLTFPTFNTWFQQAMIDMVEIFNGENTSTADDYSHKLVFTGEDYPWSRWDELDDLLARDAVSAGLGIRNGITELSNFHLSHIPAYGTTIAADGHMVTDESWQLFDGKRVIGTENECYNDCGFSTTDPYYAVKMSNLKALQMRVNWLYVYPGPSYMATYPEHWEWVRLSLGQSASTSPDAWVALREAEDRYWLEDDSHTWPNKPWVRNLERWLVHSDVAPDGQSRRGTDVRTGVLDPDNGTAYEGRRTDIAGGQDFLYFFVDEGFVSGEAPAMGIKVTFVDTGTSNWRVEYLSTAGMTQTPSVSNTDSGTVKTATFTVSDAVFSAGLTEGADFRIYCGGAEDLEVRFVRLIKLSSSVIFADGFESGDTGAWSSSTQ